MRSFAVSFSMEAIFALQDVVMEISSPSICKETESASGAMEQIMSAPFTAWV